MAGRQNVAPSKDELAGYQLFKNSGCVACHNGATVDIMGRLQLGRKFNDDENAKIVAFLKTLTGDQPRFILPMLPPSSDATPRPKPFDK